MKRFAAALVICLWVGATAADSRYDRLPEKYRKWLREEVIWLITEEEVDGFLALEDDRQRDTFIDRFWRVRDDQPLTKENELRDEHYRRLAHVKRNLGTETSRPAYLTDRGRSYILLGKPDDTERVVSGNETYPYEMWFYGQKTAPGFPTQMRLVFFRPYGIGEYRLLHPALDRERLFPPSTQIDIEDNQQLLFALGPEVTRALDSVSPGYGANASDEIIQELRSPHRVKERILERGKALNPSIRVRTSVKPLTVDLTTMVSPGRDGAGRVHIAVELPPAEVSFQEIDGDRFLARVDVFGDVRDERDLVVARIDEIATLDLAKDALEERKGHGFAFHTVRTLVPGRYKVALFLQDFVEGRLAEARGVVVVPAPSEVASIDPAVLAFRVDRSRDSEQPFAIEGFKVVARPSSRVRPGDTVWFFGLLRETKATVAASLDVNLTVAGADASQIDRAVRERKATAPPGKNRRRPLVIPVPTAGLAPGPYTASLTVSGADGAIASTIQNFEIVTSGAPSPGLFLYEEKRPSLPEVEHYNRGIQFLSAGQLAEAEKHFRIALNHRQTFKPAAIYLARVLIISGRDGDAGPLLARVLDADPHNYDGLVTRATLDLQREEYAAATASFTRALESGPRSKELLNGLAEAAIGQRQADTARRWLRESLAIDPEQPAIQRRLAALGG